MRRSALGLMLAITAASGCTNGVPPVDAGGAAIASRYALGAGDKLRITVYNEAALTGEYAVTDNGTIAFPLIGGVPVLGKSVEGVEQAIREKLSAGYVSDPRVSAEVINYRPFYILGEVTKPGEYPYSVGLTVVQAVAAAGGFTYRANRRRVVLRRAADPEEHSVDIAGGKPPLVLPGDTIRVGERYF